MKSTIQIYVNVLKYNKTKHVHFHFVQISLFRHFHTNEIDS